MEHFIQVSFLGSFCIQFPASASNSVNITGSLNYNNCCSSKQEQCLMCGTFHPGFFLGSFCMEFQASASNSVNITGSLNYKIIVHQNKNNVRSVEDLSQVFV